MFKLLSILELASALSTSSKASASND